MITAFAIAPITPDSATIVLVFFSMEFITSVGFSINDYFGQKGIFGAPDSFR